MGLEPTAYMLIARRKKGAKLLTCDVRSRTISVVLLWPWTVAGFGTILGLVFLS